VGALFEPSPCFFREAQATTQSIAGCAATSIASLALAMTWMDRLVRGRW
jgi:hypothetical protein